MPLTHVKLYNISSECQHSIFVKKRDFSLKVAQLCGFTLCEFHVDKKRINYNFFCPIEEVKTYSLSSV